MAAAPNSSLLHATLQNLHIAQQQRERESTTPRPVSASASEADPESDDDLELVNVGEGTRPGTPVPGTPGRSRPVSLLAGSAKKDPVSEARWEQMARLIALSSGRCRQQSQSESFSTSTSRASLNAKGYANDGTSLQR